MTPDTAAPTFAALARKPDLTVVPAIGTDEPVPMAPTGTDPLVPTGTDWHPPLVPTGDADGTNLSASSPVPAVPTIGAELVPVLTESARASVRVRLTRSARARMADALANQKRHRTFWFAVGVFVTRPPETAAETVLHLESRIWLQEWMTGRLRVFCEWENVAWGHLVSIPGRAVLELIEKVFLERQSRFWIAIAIIAAGVLLIDITSHL